MDVLLKSIPLYTNQEEIQKLQSEPNAEELVAEQISAVIKELASELLASVVTELSSPNVHGCVKDFTKAEELRISGNALFSKGKYLEAVQEFSKSLALLNCSNSRSALETETCAKVLCNRALCLSKLKLHKLAENDSTEAVSIKPNHAKAFYRRSIASLDQNNISSAKIDAERAVKLLKEQGASADEAEALLMSLREKCNLDTKDGGVSGGEGGGNDIVEEEPSWTTHSVPKDLWNEDIDENNTNSANSAVSVPIQWSCSLSEISKVAGTRVMDPNSVELTESARYGRHLIVGTHELQGNTDIIQDQPVAHALTKHQRLHRCAHCCQELPLGGAYFWPCRACCVVLFCNKECRDHGNVHHVEGGPECGVSWTALLPPEVVLAVRLACRIHRDQKRGDYSNDNVRAATSSNSSSKVVSSLETCFDKLDTEEAIWRATTACAAHAAYTIGYQRSNTASDSTINFPISIADVLRALCIVNLNGIAMVPPAFGSEEDSIGIAVYPVASFLSHSCIPNVSVRFEGNTAIIRALSTLTAGTALLHCYGPQAGEMTTAQRRMMLKDQYHFFCECDACVVRSDGTSTDKIEIESEMVGLKCTTEGCLGAMQVPVCSSTSALPGSTVIDAGICSKYDLRIEDEQRSLKKIMAAVVGCTKCGAKLPEVDWNSKIAPRLARALQCYSTSCGMLESAEKGEKLTNKDINMAVAVLKESLKIRQELLHRYNQVLGATHSALSWVYDGSFSANTAKKDANKKESSKIIFHSRASLEIAERLFPANSTNIAFERLRLGTLLQDNGSQDAVKQGKDLVSAAITTLERYFGSEATAAVEEK
jgi:hypothetical protein